MSLDVKDLTGGFIIEGWEDALLGCNNDGGIAELPFAWYLTGCWIDGGDGKLEGPRLAKPALLILDTPGPYYVKESKCYGRLFTKELEWQVLYFIDINIFIPYSVPLHSSISP